MLLYPYCTIFNPAFGCHISIKRILLYCNIVPPWFTQLVYSRLCYHYTRICPLVNRTGGKWWWYFVFRSVNWMFREGPSWAPAKAAAGAERFPHNLRRIGQMFERRGGGRMRKEPSSCRRSVDARSTQVAVEKNPQPVSDEGRRRRPARRDTREGCCQIDVGPQRFFGGRRTWKGKADPAAGKCGCRVGRRRETAAGNY